MTRLDTLHKKWLKRRPGYAKAVEALKTEYEIAQRIIDARAHAGLTQAALAKRMKTTRTAIARLESGNSLPSTRTLERIAKATGLRLTIGFEAR